MGPNVSGKQSRSGAKLPLPPKPGQQDQGEVDGGNGEQVTSQEGFGTQEGASGGKAVVAFDPSKMKKTVPNMTRQALKGLLSDLLLTIQGQHFQRRVAVEPKEFSTGSLGWYNNEKLELCIGKDEDGSDIIVKVQLGINITVVGSKELAGFVPKPKE